MQRRIIILVLLSLVVLMTAAGCGLLRDPEAASGPIEAVPLAVETPAAEVQATVVENTQPAAAEPTEAPPTETLPTEAPATEVVPTEAPTEAVSALRIFTISSEGSQVRFQLDEDLRGQRTTVVGITDQVAGELAVDLADLSQTQVGVIQVNARGLATDNNFRNRAIQNEILDTGAFEFITFTPTAVEGLPPSAAVGDTVQFTIAGDLTIRDVTNQVVFNVEATVVSETQLTGAASTVVSRDAYGLVIPSVPNVANVEEEVELYIDFTANAS